MTTDQLATTAYRIRYCGDDPQIENALASVVSKLPQDVQEFVFDRCAFLSVGRACWAMTLRQMLCEIDPQAVGERWLILLEERTPAKHLESVIAHEIAHAWRGDDRYDSERPKNCESQTAGITKEWGFNGWGADAKFCAWMEA